MISRLELLFFICLSLLLSELCHSQNTCENAIDIGNVTIAGGPVLLAGGADFTIPLDNLGFGACTGKAYFTKFTTGQDVWNIRLQHSSFQPGARDVNLFLIKSGSNACEFIQENGICYVKDGMGVNWRPQLFVEPNQEYFLIFVLLSGTGSNFTVRLEAEMETAYCDAPISFPYPSETGRSNKVCRVVNNQNFGSIPNLELIRIIGGNPGLDVNCQSAAAFYSLFLPNAISNLGLTHIEISSPNLPDLVAVLRQVAQPEIGALYADAISDECNDNTVSSSCFPSDGSGFTDFQFSRASPGSVWLLYLASTDSTIPTGDFEVCIWVEELPLDCTAPPEEFCTLSEKIEVLSTSLGSPLNGPYCPGEEVRFRYILDEYRVDAFGLNGDCNSPKGFVPAFGPAWDQATFNPITNPSARFPGKVEWQYFGQGEVTYQNSNPNLFHSTDDLGFVNICFGCDISDCNESAIEFKVSDNAPLPQGWFAFNYYQAGLGRPDINDQSGDLHTTRSGDDFVFSAPNNGFFVSCIKEEVYGPYSMEFTVKIKDQIDCDAGENDASVSMFVFSDNELQGLGQPSTCMRDRPELWDAEVPCPVSVDVFEGPDLVNSNTLQYCDGDRLLLDLVTTSGQTQWTVPSPNPFGIVNGMGNQLALDLENTSPAIRNVRIDFVSTGGSASRCGSSQASFVIIEVAPNPDASISSSNQCVDEDLTLSVLDVVDASYLWEDNTMGPNTSFTLSNQSQTFGVTVTNDITGCTDEDEILIQPQAPSENITFLGDNSICGTQPTSLVAQGNFTDIQWRDLNDQILETGDTWTTRIEGDYQLVGISSNGCTSRLPFSISSRMAPTQTILGENEICPDETNNILSIIPSAQIDSYSWIFQGMEISNTSTAMANESGVYSLIVDIGGCSSEAATFQVSKLNPAQPTIQQPILGFCQNASVDLTVTGANYDRVEWSNGSMDLTTNYTLDGNPISVEVFFGNGCSYSKDIPLTDININPTVSITGGGDIDCGTTQTALQAQSNVAVTFEWFDEIGSSQGSGDIINPTSSERYTVVVTDANGCTGEMSVDVNFRALPDLSALTDTEVCEGEMIMIGLPNVSGYQYRWTGDATGSTNQINVAEGTYTLEVTNEQGCSDNRTITVQRNPLPEPRISSAGDLCVDNQVILIVDGDFETYAWEGGAATTNPEFSVVVGTQITTYQVVVTDDNGCSNIGTITIDPDDINPISVTGDPLFCDNTPTTLSVRTDPSFTGYQWFKDGVEITGAISPTLDVSEVGTYLVRVSNNDCSEVSREIPVADLTIPDVDFPDILICEESQSTMIQAPTGFNYSWTSSNGLSSANDFIDASAGDYTLEMSNFSCSKTFTFSVNYFQEVEPTISGVDDFCLDIGATTELMVSAGNIRELIWESGETTPSITITQGGVFRVTVTDDNGCVSETFKEVTANALPDVTNLFVIDMEYCEDESGTLELLGAESVYSIDLGNDGFIDRTENNPFTERLSGAQEIRIIIENANGCSDDIVVSTRTNPIPDLSTLPDAPVSYCSNGGSVTLDAGIGNTIYEWSRDNQILAGEISSQIEVSQPGMYTALVADANGCTNNKTVEVQELNELSPSIVSADICDGEIVELNAGTGFDEYEWKNANGDIIGTDQILPISTPGFYTVQVTDLVSNCTGTDVAEVAEFLTPIIPELQDLAVCNDPNNSQGGAVIIEVASQVVGVPGLWRDIDGLGLDINTSANALDFEGIPIGIYRLEYTTNNALAPCENSKDTLQVFVSDCACPSTRLINPDPVCNQSGVAAINLNDFLETIEIGSWAQTAGPENRLAGTSFDLDGAMSGTYSFTYTLDQSAVGCDNSNSIDVVVNDPPVAPELQNVFICNDPNNNQNLPYILDLSVQSIGFSGSWVDVNGLGLDLSDPSSIDFTDIPVGDFQIDFVTDDAIAPCDDVLSSLMVTVSACLCPNTALLPLDDRCNEAGAIAINLNDNVLTQESGTWTQTSGPSEVLFNNTITIDGAPVGSYEFTFTIDNVVDNCSTSETIGFDIVSPPSAGDLSAIQGQACEGEENTYNLNDYLEGADLGGGWIETSSTQTEGNALNSEGVLDVTNQSSGTYSFAYVVSGGALCEDVSQEIIFEIQSIPVANITVDEILTCGITSVTIDGSTSSSDGDLQLIWSRDGVVIADANTNMLETTSPGLYELEIIDLNTGCMASSTVTVEADVSIPTFSVVSDLPSCVGLADASVSILEINGGSGNYEFSIDDGSTYQATPDFVGLGSGEYLVRVRDDEGCETAPTIIRINNPTEIMVNAGDDINTTKNALIDLAVETNIPNEEIANIEWTNTQIDSLECAGLDCNIYEFNASSGIITYCVRVTSIDGCSASDCVTVRSDAVLQAYIPNIIDPNAENPLNKFFFVSGNEDLVMIESMNIRDRFGGIVYSAENIDPNIPETGWDGTDKGTNLESGQNKYEEGVYIYQVYVRFRDKSFPVLFKGTLTLIR